MCSPCLVYSFSRASLSRSYLWRQLFSFNNGKANHSSATLGQQRWTPQSNLCRLVLSIFEGLCAIETWLFTYFGKFCTVRNTPECQIYLNSLSYTCFPWGLRFDPFTLQCLHQRCVPWPPKMLTVTYQLLNSSKTACVTKPIAGFYNEPDKNFHCYKALEIYNKLA